VIYNTDTTDLAIGMTVSGNYVPVGTTIVSIDSATEITVSENVQVPDMFMPDPVDPMGPDIPMPMSEDVSLTFTASETGNVPSATLTVELTNVDTTDLAVGMTVSGGDVPAGATIASIEKATALEVSPRAREGTGTTGEAIKFTPLIRGRLLAINSGSNQETKSGRMIEREANITWYDQLPDNNSIAAGEWWGKEGESMQAVSVDEGVAESLNIGVGDQLTFNAAGMDLEVTVTSLRRIKWESFQPNFIFVLSPMVARELPQSFITSVNIPDENEQLVDEFLSRYPTVTSINLNSALNQIKNILNKASLAVQYMFLLALLAGVLTLVATIFASADQRRYESALLHTIGAKRSKIFQSIATEFFAIGIGAGLTAAIGAVFISGFLSTQIFELNYSPNILVLTGGLIFGAICIGCVGILAVREAVYAPPLLTLRDP
jgi:predicted lysophospholipase L1 biosynthesis ABC-type transport system permease subunit